MEVKVIQSGSIVEVYQYHQTVSLPKFSFTPKIKKYVRIKRSKADIRASSASRSRRAFMRLVNSNSGLGNQPDCFLTLTFKPEKLCDLVEANYQWKKFRQKLQRIVPNLRYCLSYEWGSKTGRFHYHIILFDFPFVPQAVIQEKWGCGWAYIKEIKKGSIANVGAYVAKYMAKDMGSAYIDNKRRYFFSRNLVRPRVFRFYFKSKFTAIRDFLDNFKSVVSFVFNSTMRFISGFDYSMFALPPSVKNQFMLMLDSYADLAL